MPTFSQLKTNIANKINDSQVDTFIGDAINAAIRYYQKQRFWFNEADTTITLTVNNPVVPNIPTDFQYELPKAGLVIEDSNQFYPLDKRSNYLYDEANVAGIGRPEIYRNRSGSLEVYFYPDQAYTLHLYYIKKYTDLSADGDTNDFTDRAEELISAHALYLLYRDYRRNNEEAVFYKQVAEDELQRLLTESNARVTTGMITPDGLLNSPTLLGSLYNRY
ncbi:MAG: hypothetical protein VW683_06780 [Betaproteobacteria bacterium]